MVGTDGADFAVLKRIKSLAFLGKIWYNKGYRKIAQPGRVSRSGREGRGSESHPSDHLKAILKGKFVPVVKQDLAQDIISFRL